MKVCAVNNISFRAKLINKSDLGKLIEGCYPSCYERQSASFVEIDSSNTDDIKALSEVAKYWMYGKFTSNIYHAACALRNGSNYYKNHKIYALTTQRSNYNNLNSDKILGLVHVSPNDDNYTFIEHFEVNPQYIYASEQEYKGIGTAMLDSLKQVYNKLSCCPLSSKYVINFYEKNGFIKKPEKFNYYIYS